MTAIAGNPVHDRLLESSIARRDKRHATQLRLYPGETKGLDIVGRHEHAARPPNYIGSLIPEDRPLKHQVGGSILCPMRRVAWAIHLDRQMRHPPRDFNKRVDTFVVRDATEKDRVVV